MKTYCDKTRARYAAKRELAYPGAEEVREGVHFIVVGPNEAGRFGWGTLEMKPVAKAEAETAGNAVSEAQAAREEKIVEMANEMQAAKPEKASEQARKAAIETRKAERKARKLVVEDPTPIEEAAEAQAEAAGGDAEFDNRKARKARKAKVADVVVVKQPAEDLPEPAPELPTAFVPDAGEIASSEYGMLTTRERAAEAAKAAGVSDPVITQTVRGMWVWRTPALNQVWRESQNPPKGGPKGPKAERPAKGPQKAGHASKMSAKHETALALIKRPQGASAAEIAKETGWLEHSARARVAADLIGKFNLPITKAKEGERGKVYRFAAEAAAA